MSLSNNAASDMVKQSFQQAVTDEYTYNRKYTGMLKGFYINDPSEAILSLIDRLVSRETDKGEFNSLISTARNVVKSVINGISRVYQQGATRAFRNGKESDTVAEQIYKLVDINSFMIDINRFTNLLKDTIILIQWNYKKNRPYLRRLDRENTIIVCEEGFPEIIKELYYEVITYELPPNAAKNAKPEQIYKWICWTEKNHWISPGDGPGKMIDDPDKRIPPPNNPNMINPYGIIPAVPVHIRPALLSFWDPETSSQLIDAAIEIIFLNTLKFRSSLYNFYRQMWLLGGRTIKQLEISGGPKNIVQVQGELGEKPTITTVDMQIDFDMANKNLDALSSATLKQYGISDTDTSHVQSAEAISLQNERKREGIIDQQPIYVKAEIELFDVMRKVWNTHNPAQKISDSTEFSIIFQESRYFPTPKDELDFLQAQAEKGYISPVDVFKRFNPTVNDEEEAKKKMTENIELYRKLSGAPVFTPKAAGRNGKINVDDNDEEEEEGHTHDGEPKE